MLSVDGAVVAMSPSPESILNEIQIRGIRFLTIEDLFSVQLPTTEETLSLASDVQFTEKMAALKLLAEFAWIGDTSLFLYPERRARRRPDVPDQGRAPLGALKASSSR